MSTTATSTTTTTAAVSLPDLAAMGTAVQGYIDSLLAAKDSPDWSPSLGLALGGLRTVKIGLLGHQTVTAQRTAAAAAAKASAADAAAKASEAQAAQADADAARTAAAAKPEPAS